MLFCDRNNNKQLIKQVIFFSFSLFCYLLVAYHNVVFSRKYSDAPPATYSSVPQVINQKTLPSYYKRPQISTVDIRNRERKKYIPLFNL